MKKTIYICDMCMKETGDLKGIYIPYKISFFSDCGDVSHAFELCRECRKKVVEASRKLYTPNMIRMVEDFGNKE